jgi:hypothetical protein
MEALLTMKSALDAAIDMLRDLEEFNEEAFKKQLARIIHDSTSFFISPRCTRAIYLS